MLLKDIVERKSGYLGSRASQKEIDAWSSHCPFVGLNFFIAEMRLDHPISKVLSKSILYKSMTFIQISGLPLLPISPFLLRNPSSFLFTPTSIMWLKLTSTILSTPFLKALPQSPLTCFHDEFYTIPLCGPTTLPPSVPKHPSFTLFQGG